MTVHDPRLCSGPGTLFLLPHVNRVLELNFSQGQYSRYRWHRKVGRITAQIIPGIGMKVLAFNPFESTAWAGEHGVDYTAARTLARECEVISLHTPLTPKTDHIIRGETLELMKTGTILINVSRGSLIDTKALTEALKSGRLP